MHVLRIWVSFFFFFFFNSAWLGWVGLVGLCISSFDVWALGFVWVMDIKSGKVG